MPLMTIEVIADTIAEFNVAPVRNSKGRYDTIYGQVTGSSTAAMIISYLTSSPKCVGVYFSMMEDGGLDSMYFDPKSASACNSALSKYDGGIALVALDNPMWIGRVQIPLGVSMMHELGHAKQYLEKPAWYEALVDIVKNNNVSPQIAESLKETQKYTKPAQDAKMAIELDNITRHEGPICTEMGKPVRTSYP